MKNVILCMMVAFLMLSFIPSQLKAKSEKNATTMVAPKTVESADANLMLARIDEINSMDKSKMSTADKRQLRKEVRDLKNNLNSLGDGVYLSAGAIILIVLLLVLLL